MRIKFRNLRNNQKFSHSDHFNRSLPNRMQITWLGIVSTFCAADDYSANCHFASGPNQHGVDAVILGSVSGYLNF